jgi:hypothetical protein
MQLKRRRNYQTILDAVNSLPFPIAEEIVPHIATL